MGIPPASSYIGGPLQPHLLYCFHCIVTLFVSFMQHDNMPCIKIESRINMNSVRSKSGVRVVSTEEPGFPGLAPLLRLSWRLGSPSNLAAASRHRRSRARVTHHRAGDEHDNEMLLDHVLFCLVSRNKCLYVHHRQYSLNVRRPRQLQNYMATFTVFLPGCKRYG